MLCSICGARLRPSSGYAVLKTVTLRKWAYGSAFGRGHGLFFVTEFKVHNCCKAREIKEWENDAWMQERWHLS